MPNSSVIQSIHSCASHNQVPFNSHTSCSLLNSVLCQKTKQLLGSSTLLQPSNKLRWVTCSHNSSTGKHEHACHLSSGFACTEDLIQQPLSCMTDIWCQRAEKLSQFWHMGCNPVVGKKQNLFPVVSSSSISLQFLNSQCWRLDGFIFKEWKHRWIV